MSLLHKLLVATALLVLSYFSAFAVQVDQLEEVIQEYTVNFPDKIYLEDSLNIDVSDLGETLNQNFSEFPLEYEWQIFSQEPQTGPILDVTFSSFGLKTVELQVYTTIPESIGEDEVILPEERKLIYKSSQNIFVYEKSIPVLIGPSVRKVDRDNFSQAAIDQGILLYSLGEYREESISGVEIEEKFSNYKLTFSEKSDYIAFWGNKEFIFSSLSELNTRSIDSSSINIVLLTSYNNSVLKNYITNSIIGKSFINTGFIADDSTRTQILRNPESIDVLLEEMSMNSFDYTLLTDINPIESYFFISRFINNLSNDGVSLSDIYIILLLPIFLTIIGISKHLIGLSTLGSIIPVFIGILYIKLGVPFTLGIIVFLLIVNMSLSKLISKYTLLYTPKVTFITIINFVVFMGLFLIVYNAQIININLDNIIYIIIFFVVAEKFITIVASKEFREYKKSFTGTIIVSLSCYGLFHFKTFIIFLTAYPEIILILIPLNFLLGRFTGLRITEYFRFREILRNVEE